jgi:hypothetical protein
MTSSIIQKFRKAFWVIGQPLSKQPSCVDCVISDLFIWRKSQDCETFFELSNLPKFFGNDISKEGFATFLFFNSQGHLLGESKVAYSQSLRQIVRISDLLSDDSGKFGSFAVFHSNNSKLIQSHGSYLTERGYVSYCYRNAPLRSYVHGNFDAIALSNDSKLEFLGSAGLLPREYRLQYEFNEGSTYEIALVNPSSTKQNIRLELVSISTGYPVSCENFKLNAGATKIVLLRFSGHGRVRALIKSRLVMARPVIFNFFNQQLDVFHG